MMKKTSKALFVEDEKSEAVASLRQGFNKLLSPILAGNMPKIYMGDGITRAIKKFRHSKRTGKSLLLIDLDTMGKNIP